MVSSTRRDLVRNSAWYSAGALVENLCSLVSGLFVARWLGPSIQGVWQTARLFLSYSDYSTLGQGLGMQRHVSVALGRRDEEAVRRYRDTGFCWSVLLMLCAAIAISGYAMVAVADVHFRFALLAIAGIVTANGINSFFNLWYKANSRFGILTVASLLRGGGFLAIVLLIWKFTFAGLLWGNVAAAAAVGLFYWMEADVPPRLRINTHALRDNLRVGFPVFLVGISSLLFASLDRIVVVSRMGFADMGFYSVSTMVFMPIQVALSAAAIVLFPNVCRKFGENDSGHNLAQYLVEPLILLGGTLPAVAGFLALSMPTVIDLLLPAYSTGLRPAQIALWGLSFSAASSYCWNIVVGSGRTWWLVAASVVSSTFKVGLVFLLLRAGYGLNGVAGATMLAYVLQFLLTFLVAAAIAHVRGSLRVAIPLGLLVLTLFTLVASVYVGDFRAILHHGGAGASLRVLILVLMAAPAFATLIHAARRNKFV